MILFDEAHKGSYALWNYLMPLFDFATVPYAETKAAAKARRRQPVTEVRCPLPLLIFVAGTPGSRGHSVYNEDFVPRGEELRVAVAEEVKVIFAIDELRSRVINHLCAFEPLSTEALHQQFVKLLNITKRTDSVIHLADNCSFDDDCLQYVKKRFAIENETRSIMKEINAMLRAALMEVVDQLASWEGVRIRMQTVHGVVGMFAYEQSKVTRFAARVSCDVSHIHPHCFTHWFASVCLLLGCLLLQQGAAEAPVDLDDDISSVTSSSSSSSSFSSSSAASFQSPDIPPLWLVPCELAARGQGYLPLSRSVLACYFGRQLTKSVFESIRNHFREKRPPLLLRVDHLTELQQNEGQRLYQRWSWSKQEKRRGYILVSELEKWLAANPAVVASAVSARSSVPIERPVKRREPADGIPIVPWKRPAASLAHLGSMAHATLPSSSHGPGRGYQPAYAHNPASVYHLQQQLAYQQQQLQHVQSMSPCFDTVFGAPRQLHQQFHQLQLDPSAASGAPSSPLSSAAASRWPTGAQQ